MSDNKKKIVVLARRDHIEAMRVAAGLTIFGHDLRVIFMDRPVSQETAQSEYAELLELADIMPETTVAEMADNLPLLDTKKLFEAISNADGVINL